MNNKEKESEGFITPPNHVNFLAKPLFAKSGEIQNGAIAYLQPGGGGPIDRIRIITTIFLW